jgi:probable rRNA maturation factor
MNDAPKVKLRTPSRNTRALPLLSERGAIRNAAWVVDVAVAHAAWRKQLPGIVRLTRDTVHATVREAGIADAEISVVLASDAAVRALNQRWRSKDAPTNVLSFASGEPHLLGDIVLAFETVAREAHEQGKPFAHHLRHLIVHGVLHLLGYDHDRPRDATRMENRERHILAGFDIPDPYWIAPEKRPYG